MQPKRILITGGAGFLGSHLCERLLLGGCNTLCVDNFSTGTEANIARLRDNPLFEVINHDVISPLFVQVDEIYNLACPASPVQYQRDPLQTIKTCVLGAMNMLELAKRLNIKIFQASTSEVYGDPQVHPQKETYWGNVNPTGPRACYNEGKRCAEALFFDYHRRHHVPIKIGRIFNTYGPRMAHDDGRVVSTLIFQALTGRPLTIYGDGSQTRSFCYVEDLMESFLRFMDCTDSGPGPINLGNPEEFTVLQLAEMIIDLTGSPSEIVFKKLPGDDPKQRRADISLAKDKLNWEPTVTLREGLLRTIVYFDGLGEFQNRSYQ